MVPAGCLLKCALSQLITLVSRDRGNTLLEETRLLNNRYAGCSFRNVEAILAGEPECLDLRAHVLEWSEDIAGQIAFKLRNRAKEAPFKTFDDAYRTIVAEIDTGIVHGRDSLQPFAWEAVFDMLPLQAVRRHAGPARAHSTQTYCEQFDYAILAIW